MASPEPQTSEPHQVGTEEFLALHEKLLSESRRIEKIFLSSLQGQPEGNQTPMRVLKKCARSLFDRLEAATVVLTPDAEDSATQVMFPGFISNPNIERSEVLRVIKELDEALTNLELNLRNVVGTTSAEDVVDEAPVVLSQQPEPGTDDESEENIMATSDPPPTTTTTPASVTPPSRRSRGGGVDTPTYVWVKLRHNSVPHQAQLLQTRNDGYLVRWTSTRKKELISLESISFIEHESPTRQTRQNGRTRATPASLLEPNSANQVNDSLDDEVDEATTTSDDASASSGSRAPHNRKRKLSTQPPQEQVNPDSVRSVQTRASQKKKKKMVEERKKYDACVESRKSPSETTENNQPNDHGKSSYGSAKKDKKPLPEEVQSTKKKPPGARPSKRQRKNSVAVVVDLTGSDSEEEKEEEEELKPPAACCGATSPVGDTSDAKKGTNLNATSANRAGGTENQRRSTAGKEKPDCTTETMEEQDPSAEVASSNGSVRRESSSKPSRQSPTERRGPIASDTARPSDDVQSANDEQADSASEREGDHSNPQTNNDDVEEALDPLVKEEKTRQENRKKRQDVYRKYEDRYLLARQEKLGIARLGGGQQGTYPRPALWHLNIWDENRKLRQGYPFPKHLTDIKDGEKLNMDDFQYSTYNSLWNLCGPKYAGQPYAAVTDVPQGHLVSGNAFPVFMSRSRMKRDSATAPPLGWEYCGNYKAVPPGGEYYSFWESANNYSKTSRTFIAKKLFQSSKAEKGYGREKLDHWREKLEREMKEDDSAAAPIYMIENREPTDDERHEKRPSLAARARALKFKPSMSNEELADILVRLDEFHGQVTIQFVEYDERIYDYCKGGPTSRDGKGNKVEKNKKPATAKDWYDFAEMHMLM